jgi:dTDP-glucose 4,6-dehydratase
MAQAFLVTGATGYVGAALSESLAQIGPVTGLSRRPPAGADIAFIGHDIALPLPDRPALAGATVIHCAAEIRSTDRQRHWDTNVIGTRNLMAWCARHQVRRVVLFSTGSVYGFVEGHRMRESDPVRPEGPYAESKHAAEAEAERAADQAGLELIVFRLYFPFSRKPPAGLFHLIEDSLRQGHPLRINRAGKPRITPTHLADVAEAVRRGATGGIPAGCYNLCGDADISFLDLVRAKARRLGVDAKLVFTDRPCSDMMGSNLALRAAGWRPTAGLDDFIEGE